MDIAWYLVLSAFIFCIGVDRRARRGAARS